MYNRLFDNEGNVYRSISGKIYTVNKASVGDDEVTMGESGPEDRMFDNSGKLYRNLANRIDNEEVYRLQKEYDGTSGKDIAVPEYRTSSLSIGKEVTIDKDLLFGSEERTFKALNPSVNVEEDYFTVIERMKDIYIAKNSDYGNSFDMTLDKYGIIGAIVRMQDKMNRIDEYYWKPDDEKKVDESLIDTIEDLGNYAIMTSVWLRNQ